MRQYKIGSLVVLIASIAILLGMARAAMRRDDRPADAILGPILASRGRVGGDGVDLGPAAAVLVAAGMTRFGRRFLGRLAGGPHL